MAKKITNDGLEELIEKFVKYAEEERELALERYRRQDESMTTPDDFVLQGKNAVDFLKTASERSNSLLNAAKMVKEILYSKNEGGQKNDEDINDEIKKHVMKVMKEERDAV